jgi:hypothetical protein
LSLGTNGRCATASWNSKLATDQAEDDMKKPDGLAIGRRDLLLTFTAGAVAFTAGGPLVKSAAADTESGDEKRKPRYRQTEHIKTFYRVNRYPS